MLAPPTSLVVRTVRSVFPNCRLFREHVAEDGAATDFANLVFFCRKGNKPFEFREPVEADYLGTMSRRHSLAPQHEVDMQSFDAEGAPTKMPELLTSNQTSTLIEWQHRGAAGHWSVMRKVLPSVVWEQW